MVSRVQTGPLNSWRSAKLLCMHFEPRTREIQLCEREQRYGEFGNVRIAS